MTLLELAVCGHKSHAMPYRILSLDGGGIRGLITIIFMEHYWSGIPLGWRMLIYSPGHLLEEY